MTMYYICTFELDFALDNVIMMCGGGEGGSISLKNQRVNELAMANQRVNNKICFRSPQTNTIVKSFFRM